MKHRGASIVLIGTSVIGIGCATWMTLRALPLAQALVAFGFYAVLVSSLAWSVLRLFSDLRDSGHRYRALFESSGEAVLILDGNTIVECNPAAAQMLATDRDEILGRSILEFGPPKQPDGLDSAEVARRLSRAVLQGERPQRELLVRRADGSTFVAEVSLSRVEYGSKVMGQLVARDVSARKEAERVRAQLERNLRWAQKMEAVGTLAGGVAHDFNNLMHVVTGYSDLLLMDPRNGHIHQELGELKDAARRAGELTQRLLLFSRKVEGRPERLDLNEQVRQVTGLLRRTIPKMIQVEARLTDRLLSTQADRSQVEQVLMNLALNARDAMPDGGKLVFETRAETISEHDLGRTPELTPGRYVVVTVTDNGEGMDQATQERVFEPFFTTKEAGQGTGLGLAIVYGIVKSHRGHIRCQSEPGVGTAFTVYLPGVEREPVHAEPEVSEIPPPRGTEVVLLVDDEPQVREVGKQLLEAQGYQVLEASTGEEALQLLQGGQGRPDLVVLDYIMPGMGGRRCLDRMQQLAPTLPVIVASGYSAQATSDDLLRQGAAAFVGKPYQARMLLEVVRGVLDRTRPGQPAASEGRVLH